jgi:hypothetical protein
MREPNGNTNPGRDPVMRALFEARVEHLTADRIRIECVCRRVTMISVVGLGLPGYLRILDLKRRLKCNNCDRKGEVDITIVWADR